MFFMPICELLVDLIESTISNNFNKWASNPGYVGLSIVSVVMAIYIFMPMLIRSINTHWFRWAGLTACPITPLMSRYAAPWPFVPSLGSSVGLADQSGRPLHPGRIPFFSTG